MNPYHVGLTYSFVPIMEVLIAFSFWKYINVNRVKFRRVSKQVISLIRLFSTEPGHKQADLGIIKAKK